MKNKGFTLLEVMVAISVMAIVLVSVYRMHSQTISMSSAARFYTTAPLLAQRIMAEFELKTLDDLRSDSGDFGDDFPNYSWHVTVEDIDSEILGETADNLKQVNVSVSDGASVFEFRTYLFAENKG
jgi:general secretion pathway protein I